MKLTASWYPTDNFDENYEGTTWTSDSYEAAVLQIKSRIQSYPGTSTGSIKKSDGTREYITLP
jgi:hypothetical protein